MLIPIIDNPLFWALLAMFGGCWRDRRGGGQPTIGILLTPVWAAVFWLHALIEEEGLQRAYGVAYKEYIWCVPSRLIPGIPA